MKNVTIIDYGNGNTNSIKMALDELGVSSIFSSKAIEIANADYIILPGVGHFGSAMTSLRTQGLISALNEAVLMQNKPVLGICLGMQLMTQFSEESQSSGLGWVQAVTRRIVPENRLQFKVPHVGWNIVCAEPSSRLLRGISTGDEPFYFCHAYAIDNMANLAVTSHVHYDKSYIAAFELGNIFGVQFHPEKSQDNGLKLIKNFLEV